MANDPNYAPQSYIDKTTKELVGFDVDTALGMASILGLKAVWKHPDWNTIPAGLQAGLYDVSIGSMTITSSIARRLSTSPTRTTTPRARSS